MKTYQSLLLIGASLIAVGSSLLTGCEATSGSAANGTNLPPGTVMMGPLEVNTNQACNAIKEAAALGAVAAVTDDTNAGAYFQAVDVVIQTALESGDYDPTNLTVMIGSISNGHLKHPALVAGAVGVGLSAYNAFFGEVVTSSVDNASPFLAPALAALESGFQSVVGQ